MDDVDVGCSSKEEDIPKRSQEQAQQQVLVEERGKVSYSSAESCDGDGDDGGGADSDPANDADITNVKREEGTDGLEQHWTDRADEIEDTNCDDTHNIDKELVKDNKDDMSRSKSSFSSRSKKKDHRKWVQSEAGRGRILSKDEYSRRRGGRGRLGNKGGEGRGRRGRGKHGRGRDSWRARRGGQETRGNESNSVRADGDNRSGSTSTSASQVQEQEQEQEQVQLVPVTTQGKSQSTNKDVDPLQQHVNNIESAPTHSSKATTTKDLTTNHTAATSQSHCRDDRKRTVTKGELKSDGTVRLRASHSDHHGHGGARGRGRSRGRGRGRNSGRGHTHNKTSSFSSRK